MVINGQNMETRMIHEVNYKLSLKSHLFSEIESLVEIQQRSQKGDKEAKDFLVKLKPKMLASSRKSKNLVTEL